MFSVDEWVGGGSLYVSSIGKVACVCSRWGPSVFVVGRDGRGSAVLERGETLYLYTEFLIPVF